MEEEQEEQTLFFEVFRNEVCPTYAVLEILWKQIIHSQEIFLENCLQIFHHLGTFLDLKSMKTMREVCRLFNDIVLTLKKFRAESVITLDESSLLDPDFSSLSLQPGHLIIYPFILKKREDRRSVTEEVCKLAEGCHSLTVWDRDDPDVGFGNYVVDYRQIWDPDLAVITINRHCPYVWDVLVAAKSMIKLSLPERSIHYLNPELMKVAETQDSAILPACLKEICLNAFSADVLGAFEKVKGLERVRSTDIDPEGSHTENHHPKDWSSFKYFLGMHRNSLVELHLPCDEFWEATADLAKGRDQRPQLMEYEDATVEDLGLRLPNLRSLTMRARSFRWKEHIAFVIGADPGWVHDRMKKFLSDYIGQLEKLKLFFCGKRKDLVRDFPLVHGKGLKSLTIVSTYVEKSVALLSWLEQIRELPLLEELELGSDSFGLTCWYMKEGEVFDLFSYFPSSLRSFKMKSSDSLCIVHVPWGDESPESLTANPESLQRLSNLVTLEIHGKAFGDDIFRGICTYLVSLKSLVMRSCAITDATFVGKSKARGGPPLEDPPLAKLRNLTYLRLDTNNDITPNVLQFGVKCKRLQEINIVSCSEIEGKLNKKESLIFERLALNNPTLHMVKIGDDVWRRFGETMRRFDLRLDDDMFHKISEVELHQMHFSMKRWLCCK